MIIQSANYTGSFVDVQKCPAARIPEFAFIGRSNVGKSSLINMVTQRRHLAKTSARPGKTQTINYFLINEEWNLVDLPGYGFAKVSRDQRGKWEEMIANYLKLREQLLCVFQLVDGSIPPQKIDLEFSDWLGEHEIPFVIVFTKTDKRPKGTLDAVADFKKAMLAAWHALPNMFVTSAEKHIGAEPLLQYIDSILKGLETE